MELISTVAQHLLQLLQAVEVAAQAITLLLLRECCLDVFTCCRPKPHECEGLV